MATGGKKQTDFQLTKTIMKNNWGLLKEIRVADIVDSMIEKSLVNIDDGISIQRQTSGPKQAEEILYIIFKGPQSHRDSFLKILETKGYDHIVQKLKDKTVVVSSRTPRKSKETLESEAITKQFFSEMKADLQKQQQQQHMELMKQTEKMAKELKEHQEKTVKGAFEELKQSDEQRKENETKIKQLESELSVLQDELKNERLKVVQSQERIKELEKEIKTVNHKLESTKKKVNDILTSGV